MPVELSAADLWHLAITCTIAEVLTDERQRLLELAELFRSIASSSVDMQTLWAVPLSRNDARLLLKVCRSRLESFERALQETLSTQCWEKAAPYEATLAQRRASLEAARRQLAALEMHARRPLARIITGLPKR